MELERWAELSAAISAIGHEVGRRKRDQHSTALVVRVHTWAALHDRPVSWACEPKSWTDRTRPETLPDQSTMSRRVRRADFEPFQLRVGQRLNGKPARGVGSAMVKVVDGHPLELPNHSTDRDATWSRGVSRTALGYKLHAVWSAGSAMPEAFVVTTLNVCEKRMAARMIARAAAAACGRWWGYLLGDAHYDASWLFDLCHHHGLQLLCPRPKPGTGVGHHYCSTHRVRCIEMLESPAGVNPFGPTLYDRRTDVEREFSGLSCFGGGMATLPPWVRRIWRVRPWVTAKLLINAARVRLNQKKAA